MKQTAADDNLLKHSSRAFIAEHIKDYFKNKDISMFEFLGAGVGAEYYLSNIPNLVLMTLLDGNKQKVNKFLLEKYRNLFVTYMKQIEVFHSSLDNFLDKINVAPYDVFNLDFCGFLDTDPKSINNRLINKVFETNAISKNGMLLCTFMVKGYGVNNYKNKKNILTSPIELGEEVIKIARKHGYKICKNSTDYIYKSSKVSTMVNLIFYCGRDSEPEGTEKYE